MKGIVNLICLVVLIPALLAQLVIKDTAANSQNNSETRTSRVVSSSVGVDPVLQEAVNEVSQTLVHDAMIVNQEVSRVDGLIKESVHLMSDSFHTMHDLASRQAALTAEIIDQTHEGDSQGGDQKSKFKKHSVFKAFISETRTHLGSVCECNG